MGRKLEAERKEIAKKREELKKNNKKGEKKSSFFHYNFLRPRDFIPRPFLFGSYIFSSCFFIFVNKLSHGLTKVR